MTSVIDNRTATRLLDLREFGSRSNFNRSRHLSWTRDPDRARVRRRRRRRKSQTTQTADDWLIAGRNESLMCVVRCDHSAPDNLILTTRSRRKCVSVGARERVWFLQVAAFIRPVGGRRRRPLISTINSLSNGAWRASDSPDLDRVSGRFRDGVVTVT